MRALGWGFLGPFDLISNSPWNCSTDTWCAAGILLKLGLGAWLDQRPACPSIKMKKSKLSHWTWEIEWEECHFSFETEQKLSHSDEHLFYNPVTQSTKIINWRWTMFENCHISIFSKKIISKWAVPYQKDKFWRDHLKIDLFGTKHLNVIYECMSFFRGHFGPIWGLFCVILAQNLKLSQASHVKTQKDRKRSRIPI